MYKIRKEKKKIQIQIIELLLNKKLNKQIKKLKLLMNLRAVIKGKFQIGLYNWIFYAPGEASLCPCRNI